MEDIVLPVLNEKQVNIAKQLIHESYPLAKLPIEDVLSCCCCARWCRKKKIHVDSKIGIDKLLDSTLDKSTEEGIELINIKEVNNRLEGLIKSFGDNLEYLGDSFVELKKKEIANDLFEDGLDIIIPDDVKQ